MSKDCEYCEGDGATHDGIVCPMCNGDGILEDSDECCQFPNPKAISDKGVLCLACGKWKDHE